MGASPSAWSRQAVVDGVYRLDEGALWDDVFHCLRDIGVMALLVDYWCVVGRLSARVASG